MFWRGWFLVPVVLIGLLIGSLAIAAATHWDDDDRGPRVVQVTSPSGDTAGGTQVIEVHERGWHGGGFFPGFFLFPLLFFLLIGWLVFGLFRRGGPGGPWRGGRFEEWHRQQHAGDAPPPPPTASA
jgi:hypothetical protein